MAKEIQLTGKTAIIVAVIVIAFGLFNYSKMQKSLDTDAKKEIITYIQFEILREYVPSLTEAFKTGNPDVADLSEEMLKKKDSIQIVSLKARGSKEDVIIKAEILIDNKIPSNGKSIRYYRCEYSNLLGWRVNSETSSWSYRLKLF